MCLINRGFTHAIVAPKDSKGKEDLKQIKPIVDFLFSKGIDGLYIPVIIGDIGYP